MEGFNGWKALGFNSYQEYISSEYWKNKKDWILECFEWTCQKCKSKRNLIVHHKNYDSVGNENIHDVTVLCKQCHKKEHDK
jgi:5-methylcytosine-specific restriction endonuclease McrA